MKCFAALLKMEMRLFTRDFFGFFFALVFPVMMVLLFGGIYGNEPVYGGFGMMDITVPAYATMVTGVTGIMSLPITLAGYKERKIYKRFDASPAGKKNVIAAQVTVNVIMTVIGILILLIAGRLIYHIEIRGSVLPIAAAMCLSIAAMFSIGFLLTAIGRDQKNTMLMCYIVYFTMLFLSGATMPDMLFPDTIKKISAVLPMTYAVDLMQGAFAGEPFRESVKEIIILAGVTLVCTITGGLLYKNKDWT